MKFMGQCWLVHSYRMRLPRCHVQVTGRFRVMEVALISLAAAVISFCFLSQPSSEPSCMSHAWCVWAAINPTVSEVQRHTLPTTGQLHITMHSLLHATSQTGVSTQSQYCPGLATMMLLAVVLQEAQAGQPSHQVCLNMSFNIFKLGKRYIADFLLYAITYVMNMPYLQYMTSNIVHYIP